MTGPFKLTGIPDIIFGEGTLSTLPDALGKYGNSALLVLGSRSFQASAHREKLQAELDAKGISYLVTNMGSEPTTGMIDGAAAQYREAEIDVLVSIGGGSVIDAGKALSAMLTVEDSVVNYLEGVGTKSHPGSKIPFIAVPTTAGTGSEATKNAVICRRGTGGFKKSLRHDNFVPDLAIVDPGLTLGCPPGITAISGLDAFSQLLESYTSTKASPVTDSMAIDAISCVSRSLTRAWQDGTDIAARGDMSFAAMISGITLANAGLGLIHGLASTIGGLYDIPHGAICGNLLGVINRMNINRLLEEDRQGTSLKKYAAVGKAFSPHPGKSDEYYARSLADRLDELVAQLNIPRLSEYVTGQLDLDNIIASSGHKNNPVTLERQEIEKALRQCI